MMEVVQLVEVSGQEHQVMENFEDLILTVVPEGQEAEAMAAAGASGDGQRTIVVTEVRNQETDDNKTKEIENLQTRVEQLEDQVHFLEDELRLMRRKIQATPTNSYSSIRRTVLEVLSKQTMKISVSDFEDEMESQEPLARTKYSHGQKRKKFENGFSDDDDEDDFSEEEHEPEPPIRKRRGPGRPPKSKYGSASAKKPKTHRVELTPPPPKISRPRGRPRRIPKPELDETTNLETEMTGNAESITPHVDDGSMEGEQNVTVEGMSTEEGEPEHVFVAENDMEETEEMEDIGASVADDGNVNVKAELDGSATGENKATDVKVSADESKMSPKRGRRRATDEKEKEPEVIPTPVRASTRARKISRKGSD